MREPAAIAASEGPRPARRLVDATAKPRPRDMGSAAISRPADRAPLLGTVSGLDRSLPGATARMDVLGTPGGPLGPAPVAPPGGISLDGVVGNSAAQLLQLALALAAGFLFVRPGGFRRRRRPTRPGFRPAYVALLEHPG